MHAHATGSVTRIASAFSPAVRRGLAIERRIARALAHGFARRLSGLRLLIELVALLDIQGLGFLLRKLSGYELFVQLQAIGFQFLHGSGLCMAGAGKRGSEEQHQAAAWLQGGHDVSNATHPLTLRPSASFVKSGTCRDSPLLVKSRACNGLCALRGGNRPPRQRLELQLKTCREYLWPYRGDCWLAPAWQ